MMKFKIVLIALVVIVISACAQEKTIFPQEALSAKLMSLKGENVTLEDVLKKHQGKTIVLDIWASWCSDCIKGLPLVKALQEQTKSDDLEYVFLSVDRKLDKWKSAIDKRNIIGDHYLVSSGSMKGSLGKSIDLDWIPRYMVIGKDGSIKLYKAIKANDAKILEAIKADK
ncbi:MAG: alkyl hydroperoxide reductase [Kordia sp.]|nr:MAG: alkyl hydroperoxide reductase [Kordia sp.]